MSSFLIRITRQIRVAKPTMIPTPVLRYRVLREGIWPRIAELTYQ
jgi:hypothetical protein